MQRKTISKIYFQPIMEAHWEPLELTGDLLPDFAASIPADKRYRILASGESNAWARENNPPLVGGFDVYRHSPDDPVRYNKDWYAVVDPGSDSDHLIVQGPQRDREHWLNEIPARYDGVRILVTDSEKLVDP